MFVPHYYFIEGTADGSTLDAFERSAMQEVTEEPGQERRVLEFLFFGIRGVFLVGVLGFLTS